MHDEIREEMNLTVTENGALAYISTGSECLNLFASAGALRFSDSEQAEKLFIRAFAENSDYALRILFYARDIRGGLGERRLFRNLLKLAAIKYPDSIQKNIGNIPYYGRFDDCLTLLDTPCEDALVQMISSQLAEDISAMNDGGEVSLIAKWLPSVNASSESTRAAAKKICGLMRISHKDYRKKLSALRSYIDVLEKRLTDKDYSFDYEKQPSKALFKYRKAFIRNDTERYANFINDVRNGKATLKTGTLYPYEVIRCVKEAKYIRERLILDTTWNNLPDYTQGKNALAVVDGSSSMYWNNHGIIRPIDVAVSLGLYFAERNVGTFHGYFMTFSENPRFVKVKGKDIYQKVSHCMSYNEVANTNLEKVFLKVLKAAVKYNVPQEEMPEAIYIISDMEFDYGCYNCDESIFRSMKKLYASKGYKLPLIVYWNVESRNEQHPVTKNESGAVLVSGCSPSVFASAMNPDMTPYEYMQSILEGERYCRISA